jgi:HlyD family secretion protein
VKKSWIIAAGVIVVGAGALALLSRGGKDEEPAAPGSQLQREVTLARGDLDLTVSADGIVQPINKVEVKSKASGQILELNMVEGQEVKKGDLLIALDQKTALNDYEQAKADLELAEANATQQENNFNRSAGLFEKNMISQQERDLANVEFVRAKSSLVKARAALSSADERLRDTRIRAPIDGILLTKNVESGQIISSGVSNVGGGTLLATLADMTQVYVETNVDEVDIGRVAVGQSAKVVADAYPDDPFTGEVIRIAPLGKTSQNVTVFSVIILVKNRGGKLKAGMSASVDIEIFRRQNVLLVPNEALVDPRSEQGRALLAANAEGAGAGADTAGAGPGPSGPPAGVAPDPGAWRERMQSMSAEEREKMRAEFRKRMEQMSPDERERMRAMRGGGGWEGGGSGRKVSQATKVDEARRRVVMVRDSGGFSPRLVTVGAANYDFSEVLEGLQEGDEIQITTISRAKQEAEAFTERMRSRQSMGGVRVR